MLKQTHVLGLCLLLAFVTVMNLSPGYSQPCNLGVDVISIPDLNLQGGTSVITLDLTNPTGSPTPAFTLTITTGPEFLGTAVSTGTLNNPNTPDPEISFPANAIGANSTITITINIAINPVETCNIINDFATQPYFINTFHVMGCGGNIVDANASGFSIKFPRIRVLSAQNPTNVFVGQILFRQVELINLGNQDYDHAVHGNIHILDNHTAEFKITNITGSAFTNLPAVVTNQTTNSQYNIGSAELTALLGATTLPVFTGTEIITYWERIEILQCNTGLANYATDITPSLTFNSVTCATGPVWNSHLTRQQGFPIVTMGAIYDAPRDYCYGATNQNTIRVTLANTGGSAPARNIVAHLFKEPGIVDEYTDIISAFTVVRINNGVSSTLTLGTDYTITSSLASTGPCDAGSYFDDYVFTFADHIFITNGLLTFHQIRITYNIQTCCPTFPGIGACYGGPQQFDAWKSEATYGGFCDGHTDEEVNEFWVTGDQHIGDDGGFTYDGPNNILVPWGPLQPPEQSGPYDVEFTYIGTPPFWPYNTSNAQFFVDVTLGPNVTFCGDGITDFNLATVGGAYNPSIAPVYLVGSNTHGIMKTIRLTFNLPSVINLTTSLNNSDLQFCIIGNCPLYTGGADAIGITYLYNPDPTCAGNCIIPFSCHTQPLAVQCPGCVRQGIHCDSYRINRTTFGFPDQNNNGRWNSNVAITPATVNTFPGIRQRRIMFGDEFEGVMRTHVKLTGYEPSTWTPFSTNLPELDFEYGYWHCVFDQGQNQTPLTAWVVITEHDVTALCPTPPCTMTLDLPAPIDFVPNGSCYGGLTGRDFYYDFSLDALQLANPTATTIPLRFSHNMELEFHNTFRQTGNVGPDFETNAANNLVYLALREEDQPNVTGQCLVDPDDYGVANYNNHCNNNLTPLCEDFQWYCTRQGDSYVQVGFNVTGSPSLLATGYYDFSIDGCFYIINFIHNVLVGPWISPTSRTNAFPFEYRRWSHFDHIDATFPPGMVPLGIARWELYSTTGLNWYSTTAPPTINNVVSLYTAGGTTARFNIENFMLSGQDGVVLNNPTTWFIRPEDDYYLHMQLVFGVDCDFPDGPQPQITLEENSYFSPYIVNAVAGDEYTATVQVFDGNGPPFAAVNCGIVNRNDPDLAINVGPPNPNALGYNDPVCWDDITVVNGATGANAIPAANVWLAVNTNGNSSAGITLFSMEVQDINPPNLWFPLVDAAGVNPGPGNYLLNNMYYVDEVALPHMRRLAAGGGFYNYRVCATHVNCLDGDELVVMAGWHCDPRLNTVPQYQGIDCDPEITTDLLIVDPTGADMLVCVNGDNCPGTYVPVTAQPCSTVTYNINIYSYDLAFLENAVFNMDLLPGSGLTFAGNATVTYMGGLLGTITPVGSNLNFDFTNAIFTGTVIDNPGLPGLLNLAYTAPDDHFITVTVTLQTGCDFTYNPDGGFELTVVGSVCQQEIETYHDFYNPILESPTSVYDQLDVSLSITPSPICPNVLSGSVTVTNNSTTASNSLYNVLYLNLPVGMIANSFSINPVNPGGPSPYHWAPGVLGGLINSSSTTITFNIALINMPCATYDLIANVYTDDNVVCMGQPCSTVHVMQNEMMIHYTLTPPNSAFNFPTNAICLNDNELLSALVNCPGVTYSWNVGGTLYTGNPINPLFSTLGTIPVTLTTTYGTTGCSSQTNNNVEVEVCDPCDDFDITINSTDDCYYTFSADIPPGIPCSNYYLTWTFGDGATASGTTVTHQYLTSGNFVVCYQWACVDEIIYGPDSCFVCDTIEVNCLDTLCKRIDRYDFLDIGEAITRAKDGCAIAGTMYDINSTGNSDMYFVKYGPQLTGSTAIAKALGGGFDDYGYSIVFRDGDGYYIAGTSNADDGKDILIVKLDLSGSMLWSYRYGAKNYKNEEARKIIDVTEGGGPELLIVGFTDINGKDDALALKIKGDGSFIDAEVYAGPADAIDRAYDVVRCNQDGQSEIITRYYIVGESIIPDDHTAFVLSIGTNLNLINSTLIMGGNKFWEEAKTIALVQQPTGAMLIIGGSIEDKNSGTAPDLYLVKLNLNLGLGAAPNSVILGNTTSAIGEKIHRMTVTHDNNLVIAANIKVDPASDIDGMLLLVDPKQLLPFWAKIIPDPGLDDWFKDVMEMDDGDFVVTGSYPVTTTDSDILITRTNSKGESCCVFPYQLKDKKAVELKEKFESKKVELETEEYGMEKEYYKELLICPTYGPRMSQPVAAPENGLHVYPNPTTGWITITMSEPVETKMNIMVTDVVGKTITVASGVSLSQQAVTLDLSNLHNGVYFITASSGNQTWNTKFTIQR